MTLKPKTVDILIAVLFLTLIMTGVLGAIAVYPEKDEIKNVPCYDRFSNQIEGASCLEVTYGLPQTEKAILMTFVVLFLGMAGAVVIVNIITGEKQ